MALHSSCVVDPCTYGEAVLLGPDFDGGSEGQGDLGVTTEPSDTDYAEWARSCLGLGEFSGNDLMGGWSPTRSIVVRWNKSGKAYYYRNEDTGRHDVVRNNSKTTRGKPKVLKAMKRFIKVATAEIKKHDIKNKKNEIDNMVRRELAYDHGMSRSDLRRLMQYVAGVSL